MANDNSKPRKMSKEERKALHEQRRAALIAQHEQRREQLQNQRKEKKARKEERRKAAASKYVKERKKQVRTAANKRLSFQEFEAQYREEREKKLAEKKAKVDKISALLSELHLITKKTNELNSANLSSSEKKSKRKHFHQEAKLIRFEIRQLRGLNWWSRTKTFTLLTIRDLGRVKWLRRRELNRRFLWTILFIIFFIIFFAIIQAVLLAIFKAAHIL